MAAIRKGDIGLTNLLFEKNIKKSDARIFALSFLDRLNCELGNAKLQNPKLKKELAKLQVATSAVMARLCGKKSPLEEKFINHLNKETAKLAAFFEKNKKINQFVVPGICREETALHLCRATTRIAECYLVKANAPKDILPVINRMSLYLFYLACKAAFNKKG
ncbi:MAG: ATP:cob(I)alamin adenosyltransferase [Elusimicrobiota bacterium]|jgi:ATP:cob(I)alamin adenosyltransferase|nr:ATP:cob(I)alamin adenosyltransferase [Elusimicrobiota bacterium]